MKETCTVAKNQQFLLPTEGGYEIHAADGTYTQDYHEINALCGLYTLKVEALDLVDIPHTLPPRIRVFLCEGCRRAQLEAD